MTKTNSKGKKVNNNLDIKVPLIQPLAYLKITPNNVKILQRLKYLRNFMQQIGKTICHKRFLFLLIYIQVIVRLSQHDKLR